MTGPRELALRALLVAVSVIPTVALAQEGPLATRTDAPRFSIEARRDSVVVLARQQIGRRYVFGGTSPSGFDCSGFTQYLGRAFGLNLPRTAAQQARVGEEIPRDVSRLRPGDLLTFGRGGRVTHIGVYVGNGRYVHASSGRGQITESSLDRPQSSLVRAWMGVRRVFGAEADSASVLAQRPVAVPRPRSVAPAAPAAPRVPRRRS
jgi:cell wall-associated NlpC family hydrolase